MNRLWMAVRLGLVIVPMAVSMVVLVLCLTILGGTALIQDFRFSNTVGVRK